MAASAASQEVVDQAGLAARGDGLVLLVGPSGSGRSQIARAIHEWSPRAGGPLIEVGGTTTPESLQHRELFGGSADGGGPEPGAIERAAGGTLVIDNADRLGGAVLQALLQALRDEQIATAGGAVPIRARLILTASEGGEGLVGDLAARVIRLTALVDRSEDVLPLAAHFLAEFSAEDGVEPVGFSADARRWLVEESWAGNIRELRERIRQAVRLAGSGAISAEALMLSSEGDDVPSFKEAKRAFETRYVEGLLRRCSGNISRAARMAKKDRKDFYDVIRRTGVDPARFRS